MGSQPGSGSPGSGSPDPSRTGGFGQARDSGGQPVVDERSPGQRRADTLIERLGRPAAATAIFYRARGDDISMCFHA